MVDRRRRSNVWVRASRVLLYLPAVFSGVLSIGLLFWLVQAP